MTSGFISKLGKRKEKSLKIEMTGYNWELFSLNNMFINVNTEFSLLIYDILRNDSKEKWQKLDSNCNRQLSPTAFDKETGHICKGSKNQRFEIIDFFFFFGQNRDLEKVKSKWFCAGGPTGQRSRTEALRTRTETLGRRLLQWDRTRPGDTKHHGNSPGLIVMKGGWRSLKKERGCICRSENRYKWGAEKEGSNSSRTTHKRTNPEFFLL